MQHIKLLKQLFLFFISSGIGFIIDFTVYYTLVKDLDLSVLYANMISAFPAITFVFIISNTSIFNVEKTTIKEKLKKYVLYCCYQAILLAVVSYFGNYIYLNYTGFMKEYLSEVQIKLVIKCIITPITMVCNFIVMKILIERLK